MRDYQKYEFEGGKVFHGDCLDVMENIGGNDITLSFTSPPYFDAVNYDEHIEKLKGEKEEWERKENVSYGEYKEFLKKRFNELFRITKEGGHAVVNISPVHSGGERIPLPFHFVSWMESIGWTFKEDIVWEKPIAKDRRSGVLIQHPYPGYYYPSVVAEYVFVFQKQAESEKKNNIYWNKTEEEKEKNKIDLSDFQGEKSKNVWKIRPVPPDANIHPAPFPVELAKRVITFYSYENDTVLDIFAGSGQSLKAALEENRDYIGIELKKEYVEHIIEEVVK